MRRNELRSFQCPESSNIKHVTYLDSDKVLYVMFQNLTTYAFSEVPIEVYKALRDADSVGRAFNSLVKGKFEYIKGGRA